MTGRKIEFALNKILADKTSGSADLLLELNKFFKKYFHEIEKPVPLIEKIAARFQTFQNIQLYLKEMKRPAVNGRLNQEFFTKYEDASQDVYQKMFVNALPYLKNKKKILTISNSRTVFEILKRLGAVNKNLSVVLCESRPKFEGRVLAKKLLNENINTEVITEAMTAKYISGCGCVLIGADSVLKNSSIVNKVGSLQAAILCKYYKKPFYVLADKSKFSSKKTMKQRSESRNEIWQNAPHKAALKNFYFETVPPKLISKIITE